MNHPSVWHVACLNGLAGTDSWEDNSWIGDRYFLAPENNFISYWAKLWQSKTE